MNLSGIILVDKPIGWSSFDVVAKIRGILRTEVLEKTGEKRKIKVGHTGTLDPQATGLMIVVVGDYCKRAQEFSKLDKTYQVQMKLGESSTTGDSEGEKTPGPEVEITEGKLKDVLDSFLGESMQTPPIYSAIKINGQRAYKLARAGKEVKLEPRPIKIYDIKLDKFNPPLIDFIVSVSSGTYIRSLVEDIAKKLGTVGYMTRLERTVVGKYSLQKAIKVEQISSEYIET